MLTNKIWHALCYFTLLSSYTAYAYAYEIAEKESIETCGQSDTERDSERADVNFKDTDMDYGSATVGKIDIDASPIFDENNPDENNWIFRLVNRLHIKTKAGVIKDDLLFKPGDNLQDVSISSSERTLNTRRYLTNANISTAPPCNGVSNVTVSTRDVWTLKPKLSLSRSGGNNNSSAGFEDSNFFGTGKSVSIMRFNNDQRSGQVYSYYDPNTGAYKSELKLRYSDNSDGIEKKFQLYRDFLDISTNWSGGILYGDKSEVASVYNLGKKVFNYEQQSKSASVFYGRRLDSASVDNEYVRRIIFGVTSSADTFTPDTIVPNSRFYLPTDRDEKITWIEYQKEIDDYISTTNIKQINRPEYFNLGGKFTARLGYSNSNISSDFNAYLLYIEDSYAYKLKDNHLIIGSTKLTGRYTDSGLLNSAIEGDVSYYWKNMERGQFFAQLSGLKGYNLYQDTIIELGGNTGLRGYPSHYQSGDKNLLFTMEQHFFGNAEWLSLFYAGAAVFFDAGSAWGTTSNSPDWVKDVGVGLRFSGTRNGSRAEGEHNVLHMDIVAPLDGSRDISSYQFRVKTEKRF